MFESTTSSSICSPAKSVVLCTVWNTLLKHIHTANLFIQRKDCSLDTQLNNLMQLKEEMANVRNDWEGYYSKAKIAASSMDLKEKDFPVSPRDCAAECTSPAEAFKRNVFYVAVDALIVGVQKCITKLDECAEKFRFLWKFDEMSDAELLACTEALQKSYPNDISEDIMNEVALLKQGFQANFNCDPKRATPQILMHGIIDSNLRTFSPTCSLLHESF